MGRAELADVLSDTGLCEQLLRDARQGYEEIGAPGYAARIAAPRAGVAGAAN